MSSNDFGTLIEDLVIVTNSKLKIENVNKQQYTVSQVMNQGYYAYVDEEDEVKQPLGSASQSKFYNKLKLIPKNNMSKNSLTHQLS
jgi:hypothetical protein